MNLRVEFSNFPISYFNFCLDMNMALNGDDTKNLRHYKLPGIPSVEKAIIDSKTTNSEQPRIFYFLDLKLVRTHSCNWYTLSCNHVAEGKHTCMYMSCVCTHMKLHIMNVHPYFSFFRPLPQLSPLISTSRLSAL